MTRRGGKRAKQRRLSNRRRSPYIQDKIHHLLDLTIQRMSEIAHKLVYVKSEEGVCDLLAQFENLRTAVNKSPLLKCIKDKRKLNQYAALETACHNAFLKKSPTYRVSYQSAMKARKSIIARLELCGKLNYEDRDLAFIVHVRSKQYWHSISGLTMEDDRALHTSFFVLYRGIKEKFNLDNYPDNGTGRLGKRMNESIASQITQLKEKNKDRSRDRIVKRLMRREVNKKTRQFKRAAGQLNRNRKGNGALENGRV